jgi:hypothetical protein
MKWRGKFKWIYAWREALAMEVDNREAIEGHATCLAPSNSCLPSRGHGEVGWYDDDCDDGQLPMVDEFLLHINAYRNNFGGQKHDLIHLPNPL